MKNLLRLISIIPIHYMSIFARYTLSAILKYIGILGSVFMSFRTMSYVGIPMSFLSNAIFNVFRLVSKKQMVGIHTRRSIAEMKNLHAIRNCSFINCIRYSMSRFCFIINRNSAIISAMRTTHPYPAPGFWNEFYSFFKSFFNRFSCVDTLRHFVIISHENAVFV